MNATTGSDRRRFDSLPATVACSFERPGLSRDEEIELAARVARGDHVARNHMVQANLGLVGAIAREFRGRGLALDDLIGEGNLGLIRAAEEFDPRFGVRFSTYAAHWIKEAIRHALINTTATIRVPAWMVGLLTRWRRAERALGRELGRFAELRRGRDIAGVERVPEVPGGPGTRGRPAPAGGQLRRRGGGADRRRGGGPARERRCGGGRGRPRRCCGAAWIAWTTASVSSCRCATAWKATRR